MDDKDLAKKLVSDNEEEQTQGMSTLRDIIQKSITSRVYDNGNNAQDEVSDKEGE